MIFVSETDGTMHLMGNRGPGADCAIGTQLGSGHGIVALPHVQCLCRADCGTVCRRCFTCKQRQILLHRLKLRKRATELFAFVDITH